MSNQAIIFLKRNGFEKMEPSSYANDKCNAVIKNDNYELADNYGNVIYSKTN